MENVFCDESAEAVAPPLDEAVAPPPVEAVAPPPDEEGQTDAVKKDKGPLVSEDIAVWRRNAAKSKENRRGVLDLGGLGVPLCAADPGGAKKRLAADILKFVSELVIDKKHSIMSITVGGVPLLAALAEKAAGGSPLVAGVVKLAQAHATEEEKASGAYTSSLFNIWNLSRSDPATSRACREELLARDEGLWGPLMPPR